MGRALTSLGRALSSLGLALSSLDGGLASLGRVLSSFGLVLASLGLEIPEDGASQAAPVTGSAVVMLRGLVVTWYLWGLPPVSHLQVNILGS